MNTTAPPTAVVPLAAPAGQDERARFDAWVTAAGCYSHNGFNRMENMWEAWQAAISAQPSPGGQHSAWMLPDDARIVGVIADNIERGKLDHPGFYRNTQLAEVLRRMLTVALAAHQPVGAPVAFAVESKAFEAHAASRKLNLCQHPLHYLFLDRVTDEARQAWKAALAFAPPARAVDLGPGLDAAAKLIQKKADDYAEEFGYDDMGSLSFGRGHHAEVKSDHHSFMLELVDELRAPNDGQAVGK